MDGWNVFSAQRILCTKVDGVYHFIPFWIYVHHALHYHYITLHGYFFNILYNLLDSLITWLWLRLWMFFIIIIHHHRGIILSWLYTTYIYCNYTSYYISTYRNMFHINQLRTHTWVRISSSSSPVHQYLLLKTRNFLKRYYMFITDETFIIRSTLSSSSLFLF